MTKELLATMRKKVTKLEGEKSKSVKVLILIDILPYKMTEIEMLQISWLIDLINMQINISTQFFAYSHNWMNDAFTQVIQNWAYVT